MAVLYASKTGHTLMPSTASLRSDCCCVSARVRDFRALKIMGSLEIHERNLSKVEEDGQSNRTIGNDHAILPLDSFIRHSFSQVNC